MSDMLVTKQVPFKEYVGIIKLVSGEEYIAVITNETSTDFIVESPLTVAKGADGQVMFVQLLHFGDDKKPIKISKQFIMATGIPRDDFEMQYKSVTSGIVLPKKSGLIT